MGVIAKNKSKATGKKTGAVIDSKVGNYEKHPFFVKKANAAKEILKNTRLPKQPVHSK